jgi:hypothetical protein
MICTTNERPAVKKYLYRFAPMMGLYVIFLFIAVWVFSRHHPTGLLAYALAVLPSLPIVGAIVVIGLYLGEEKDEFQRTVLIQSMLWAIGTTLSVTTVWGFLEDFVHVRHLDLFLLFPLFWFLVGAITPILKARYK